MKNSVNRPTADEIADMADSGHDISRFFTNQGTMKPPFKRIIVDVAPDTFPELEHFATELRGSPQTVIRPCLGQRQRMTQAITKLKRRQAVIKPCLLQVLDQQPFIDIFRRNAVYHDAQLAVYEETAR